jgi:hypothetical protein
LFGVGGEVIGIEDLFDTLGFELAEEQACALLYGDAFIEPTDHVPAELSVPGLGPEIAKQNVASGGR